MPRKRSTVLLNQHTARTRRRPVAPQDYQELPPFIRRFTRKRQALKVPTVRQSLRNQHLTWFRRRHTFVHWRVIMPWFAGALVLALVIALAYGAIRLARTMRTPEIANPTLMLAPELESPPLSFPPLAIPSSLTLSHRLSSGDTPAKLVETHSLTTSQSEALLAALEVKLDQSTVQSAFRAGRTIGLYFSLDGELRAIEIRIDPLKRIFIERDASGSFSSRSTIMPKFRREQVLMGSIETSFAAALYKAGVSYNLVDDVVDLFSDRVNFRGDFRAGDRFALIYAEERGDDMTVPGTQTVLAAALRVNGRELSSIRYVGEDGNPRYYNETGELLGNTFLRYPLKFSRISSHFSHARFHPVLRRKRAHRGVDFAAPLGTPVRTVASGRVVFAGKNGGNGTMVRIRHDDRYSTEYLHLSKIAPKIRKGSKVSRGDVIGAVGATGLATGPHLHYGFFDRGKYIDPLKIKLPTVDAGSRFAKVSKRYLNRVLQTLERYQSMELRIL